MSELTPSVDDLACPVVRCSAEGAIVAMLRPYWQQHPDLSSPMPGAPCVSIALWRDGTLAAVPADADAAMLAKLYCGARVVAELQAP